MGHGKRRRVHLVAVAQLVACSGWVAPQRRLVVRSRRGCGWALHAGEVEGSSEKRSGVNPAVGKVLPPRPEVFVANDGTAWQVFDNGVVLPVGWTGASARRRTGARLSPAALSQFPVGEASANPSPAKVFRRSTWLQGLRDDLKRRGPLYGSDWRDGLKRPGKSAGAMLFLYFAVLAPAVAFGGVMAQVTGGALGPRDVLVSCGLSGMAYAVCSGQPMTFLAPTGLTLSFIGALSAFTTRFNVPFESMYAWCGLWTSAIMVCAATFNASGLIRYCTRFTEDVFNALLAWNFLSEGATPVLRQLAQAASSVGPARPADALLAVDAALLTGGACRTFATFGGARYLTARARGLVADFGPSVSIVAASLLFSTPAATGLGRLETLDLGSGGVSQKPLLRLVDLGALAPSLRLAAAIPALFLATLFYLDQHITVRTVNSPSNGMQKGAAYHLDLLVLGLITGAASLVGLPWMCSATVQSLAHVRALSTYATSFQGAEPPPAVPVDTDDIGAADPLDGSDERLADPPFGNKKPNKALPSPEAIILENRKRLQSRDLGDSSLAGDVPRRNARPFSVARPPETKVVAPVSRPPDVADSTQTLDDDLRPEETTTTTTTTTPGDVGDASGDDNRLEGKAAESTRPKVKVAAPAGFGASAVARFRDETLVPASAASTPETAVQVVGVVETRLTGFTVHALVLASIAVAPLLSAVPLAVVNGVFLFLATRVISGNQFLGRIKALFVDTNKLDATDVNERAIRALGRRTVLKFTAVQLACLAALWILKLNKITALIFPSVIGVLLVLRGTLLPYLFSPKELLTLDTEMAR